VLADALEEAGCTDAELLGHLRGCWPVDLVLNREWVPDGPPAGKERKRVRPGCGCSSTRRRGRIGSWIDLAGG
jgi:hypothetical protein